ncbi:hypothetical protein SAMN05444000_12029 [Shimia gijangensis]|uniref:Uncharacterized protein n=1 Tax=Shimia gijangensis TaxID=1470563 RepID=A0A1M6Q3Z8_9RHOB|nr:hypothetical protein [Shimia gijangensis]SHK14858.1 hypothetical protein SAMN05444000_12029 [Shimia gijangensis]
MEPPASDLFVAARNGAQASIKENSGFQSEGVSRCLELCMADSCDAMTKLDRTDLFFTKLAPQAFGRDDGALADIEAENEFSLDVPLFPNLVEWVSFDPNNPDIVGGSKTANEQKLEFTQDLHRNEFFSFPFWRDWYQGMTIGKPLDWELQRRVALIPDEDWEQGPEHIAKCIEEIRAQFELEKRIEELEAEKRVWTEQQRTEIGGNNPPEPIDTPETKVIREIIWAPVEELKAETKKDEPDKGRIRAAIEKLWKGIKWIGLKATEAAIAAAVGASFANPAKAQELLTGIVEAAQKWLATLM